MDVPSRQLRDLQAAGYCIFEPPQEESLESLAHRFGPTIASRPGRATVDVLVPKDREASRPGTLSFVHGRSAFPMHTETAHWPRPVELVLLRCLRPGAGKRATLLIDGWKLGLSDADIARLTQSLVVVKNGARSFLSSLVDRREHRIDFRFDASCMRAARDSDRAVWQAFEQAVQAAPARPISLRPGQCLAFDNRRMLHSRGSSPVPDHDRRLERVYVAEMRS